MLGSSSDGSKAKALAKAKKGLRVGAAVLSSLTGR